MLAENYLGAVCGSSDLNERMKKLARRHLSSQKYLEDEDGGTTIENIIDLEVMPHFENEVKRSFSLSRKSQTFPFRIRGLKESQEDPMLKRGALTLTLYENSTLVPSLY